MTMKFEEFDRVAEVLTKINPAVTNEGYDAPKLVAHMQGVAYMMEREGLTSAGTFGYSLTRFRQAGGDDWIIRATLTAYTVERHLMMVAQ